METVGFVRKKFRKITPRFQAFPENSIRFSHSPDGTESFCACQSTKLGGTAGKWLIKMPDDSLLKKNSRQAESRLPRFHKFVSYHNAYNVNFLITKYTAVFCAFTPVLCVINALLFFWVSSLLESFDIECSTAIDYIITSGCVCSLLIPIVFFYFVSKIKFSSRQKLVSFIYVYSFVEILSIEIAFERFLSSPHILCYVSDGQNGLELIFGGIIAAVITFTISLLSDSIQYIYACYNHLWR